VTLLIVRLLYLLQSGCASFEMPALRAPQDEG
jgi:hypothetical protein